MRETAYNIAKQSGSSFFYAFNLLPSPKREALNAIYSFCRLSDDIVDDWSNSNNAKAQRLLKWKVEFAEALNGKSSNEYLNFVVKYILQYNIPVRYFFELLDGMQMDLHKRRYETFDELLEYCYKAASTVGLMCIEVFGYQSPSARDYAINLGYAMQLTNIIRDAYKDAEMDRIYIPLEDINEFNVSENDFKNKTFDDRIKNLLAKQALRAKKFFELAELSLDFYDRKNMFAGEAMRKIYFRLLQKIEEYDYNVLNSNVKVTFFEKISVALKTWLKSVLIY